MLGVTIIGPGRVGGAFALALPPDRYKIDCLVTHDPSGPVNSQLSGIPATTIGGIASTSDIYFLTVRDPEIASAAANIAETIAPSSNSRTIFHTSGSTSSTVLSVLADRGWHTGSIHPLVSISDASDGPQRFKGSYFCVEGSDEARSFGADIVKAVGGVPFELDTRFKTLYHAAAVTACGHVVALFDASVEMMMHCDIEEAMAKKILLPLVKSTVDNLGDRPTSAALTGTFARADVETFTKHISALNETVAEDLVEIYLMLGERSLELAEKSGVSSERVEKLRARVAIAKSKLK
jgi:predicted short-subunit dehydrogenase-like oxidoreductase (DUF2520 family)